MANDLLQFVHCLLLSGDQFLRQLAQNDLNREVEVQMHLSKELAYLALLDVRRLKDLRRRNEVVDDGNAHNLKRH